MSTFFRTAKMLFSRAYMLFFLLGAVPLLETHAKEADVNIESLLASIKVERNRWEGVQESG